MTNQQIIAQVALDNNIFTEMQIIEMIDNGEDIPLHTLKGWEVIGRRKGVKYRIRKGEHGIATRLWKRRKCRKSGEKQEGGETEFYLAKSYLFTDSQIEVEEMEKSD
ncbi:hypothetical protein [Butyrivibrio sp. LC3010]|uniref:hypothetical protein n=1 Tax=Butyrivibrio sp. LC3010 TaxID=1280680 RepID=UPI0003F4D929|nr:hypothetical protein [Butyrivibrio sp. LC3010]